MFKAGFARVDVTPPLGTILTGYFLDRISDGILDPIQLNALALNDGEKTAIVFQKRNIFNCITPVFLIKYPW